MAWGGRRCGRRTRCPAGGRQHGRTWFRLTTASPRPPTGRPGSSPDSADGPASGVPARQVAEWADDSADVLLWVYAKCIAGQQDDAKRRIEDATGAQAGEVPTDDGEHEPDEPAEQSRQFAART